MLVAECIYTQKETKKLYEMEMKMSCAMCLAALILKSCGYSVFRSLEVLSDSFPKKGYLRSGHKIILLLPA